MFDALLDELGFDEEFVLSLNATAVLIPSDAAFAEFFSAFPEANSDPVRHVKLNSDVFKQVPSHCTYVLYASFTPLLLSSTAATNQTVHTTGPLCIIVFFVHFISVSMSSQVQH